MTQPDPKMSAPSTDPENETPLESQLRLAFAALVLLVLILAAVAVNFLFPSAFPKAPTAAQTQAQGEHFNAWLEYRSSHCRLTGTLDGRVANFKCDDGQTYRATRSRWREVRQAPPEFIANHRQGK